MISRKRILTGGSPAIRQHLVGAVMAAVLGTPAVLTALAVPMAAQAAEKDTLRPDVGKPLQEAQNLIKAQKYKDALAQIQKADAVSNKTAYESFIIEQMRGAAASGAGDIDTAAKAFEAVINSGRLSSEAQLQMLEAVAGGYYRAKNYGKAVEWSQRYFKAGGTSGNARTVLVQSYYLNGDYATAAKELQSDLSAGERAGRTPTEEQLQLLASCYLKQNDMAGYSGVLEKLVQYHPKNEYWQDLLVRIQRKPGFSSRLSLDAYRLMQATNTLQDTADYMEMAQLSLQAGYPAEAKKIVDEGFANGKLGTGADAARHKRLQELANKQYAEDKANMAAGDTQAAASKDGTALVNSGFNHVLNGEAEQGATMIEQGIAKGGLKYPDEAKLRLGIAQLKAGQKSKAAQTFKSVQGSDGTADVARIWLIISKA